MNQLRPYQVELLNQARRAYKEGYKSPCIVAPCGAGKTVIMAEMARAATRKGNHVLFLVHRKELCEQTEETFRKWDVDMSLCRIAMVQTMTRRLGRYDRPNLIITDENHHGPARTYKRIYDFYTGVQRIGVTATPIRLDGKGLKEVNDRLVVGPSAKWLVENQYLSPFDYYAPPVGANLANLRVRRGEFVTEDIEEALDKPAIYGDVIQHYRSYLDGQKAICYCASVYLSQRMAEEFNAAGVPALHIDGETPKKARAEAIESFRDGRVKILCNVDLIGEGFDVPDCMASILLRPTMSLTIFIQQSMRCMRYQPGKRAVILDHVGNINRHGMPDEDREWTLEGQKKKEKNSVGIRTCPQCYRVLPIQTKICPNCETVLVQQQEQRKIEEIKSIALQKISGFTLNYTKPEDCTSYRELLAYAARKGYKPGWAWYQAQRLGITS